MHIGNESSKRVSTWDHIKAMIALPFMVAIVIPYLLNHNDSRLMSELIHIPYFFLILTGIIIIIPGVVFFIKSNIVFHKIGNGTLAPWTPTQKLVVKDIYGYMRNPMITGVLMILLGECLLYNSVSVLTWLIIFFFATFSVFILFEEPDLQNKYGEEYIVYKKNVPRWIPRLKPWIPESPRN